MLENLERFTPEKKQRAFGLGEELLSIYSPSGNEGELARFIFEELKSRKLGPWRDEAGNVLCEIGSGKRSLLLCPHMDTVPGNLPVKNEGMKIFGRGACDAKGALLAMLIAFEDIAE